MKMTPFHSKFLMKKMKMKVFCCSSNVALATFSQRLLAEKPQMVDSDNSTIGQSLNSSTIGTVYILGQ